MYANLLFTGAVKAGESGLLVYDATARLILGGGAAHIYDPRFLEPFERALLSPLPLHGVSPFLYPPFVALILTPLGVLPYPAACILWIALNLAVLTAVLAGLRRYGHMARLTWWPGGLSFLPVFMALAVGQVSLLILGAFTAAFLALARGREEIAGFALALALVKPPYVLPFLLVLLVRRRFRALAAFAAGAAILALIPLPVLGSSADLAYAHLLMSGSHWQSDGFSAAWNMNFYGFTRLLIPWLAAPLTTLFDLATLGILIVVTRRRQDIDLPLGLAIIAGLLISPHTLIHDLALLLLPAAVMYRHRTLGPWSLGVFLAAVYAAVIVGIPLVTILPVQLSVLAMVAGIVWFSRAPSKVGYPSWSSELPPSRSFSPQASPVAAPIPLPLHPTPLPTPLEPPVTR